MESLNVFKNIDNMETKEIKIQIPEGYEIDKEKSTKECVILKEKETKTDYYPKSWDEYCEIMATIGRGGYSITGDGTIQCETYLTCGGKKNKWNNSIPNQKTAQKILAYSKLLAVRELWIDQYLRNYKWNKYTDVWTIHMIDVNIYVNNYPRLDWPLSFPTFDMAIAFKECFRDLLIEAKGLY